MESLQESGAGKPKGPVILAIMDGVGVGRSEHGDAVRSAKTPTLDQLRECSIYTQLKAHGAAVGMPTDDDMGNSEVGHNAIGCGRVFAQGASLVKNAIEDGSFYAGSVWTEMLEHCATKGSTLHLIGLLSDGNVHSHWSHVKAMLQNASERGVQKARIHTLLDGRDVGETSALEYVDPFEEFLSELNAGGVDYRIASGGGRMKITMDRYDADWPMVERGWQLHVKGEGPQFASARDAIVACREARPGVIDQDLDGFVVAENGEAVGPVRDGDCVICFNFRGDRAMELCKAFDDDDFPYFERGERPDVMFAGMMQYDGDLGIPRRYLVNPPSIDRTMGEYLASSGARQLAVSETQKYGHVTYFFNGNRSGKFADDLETYIEVPSDNVPFEERPWMKAAEITDHVLEGIESGAYDFIRVNYPNGDMVGHTGHYQAVEISVEATDLAVRRLLPAIEKAGGVLVLTADHGNADEMYELDKEGQPKLDADGKRKNKTSHSLNPVPVYIYDPSGQFTLEKVELENPGITSLTATCISLMGFLPPDDYDPALVTVSPAG